MLVLPPTLALLEPDGTGSDVDLAAREAKRAHIAPGYRIYPAPEGAPYAFYARCNVDAPLLWDAFEALVRCVPDPVGTIAGIKDQKPRMLPYAPKEEVLRVLRLYRRELSEDALIEFGLIHQTRTTTHEVFVPAAKYISVWLTDRADFECTMKALHLEQIPDLRFVDEFPRVSSSLSAIVKEALHPEDVIAELEERIDDLAAEGA